MLTSQFLLGLGVGLFAGSLLSIVGVWFMCLLIAGSRSDDRAGYDVTPGSPSPSDSDYDAMLARLPKNPIARGYPA